MFVSPLPPPQPKITIVNDHAKGVILYATCSVGKHAEDPELHVYFGMQNYKIAIDNFIAQKCIKDDKHGTRTTKSQKK